MRLRFDVTENLEKFYGNTVTKQIRNSEMPSKHERRAKFCQCQSWHWPVHHIQSTASTHHANPAEGTETITVCRGIGASCPHVRLGPHNTRTHQLARFLTGSVWIDST